MSEQEQDQPISETDLARMFDEEDQPAVEPSPEEITPPVEVPAEEPTPVTEPVTPDTTPVETEPVTEPETETPAAEGGDHMEWAARRGLTDFDGAAKLAYHQEQFLGRKASEIRGLEAQIEQLEAAVAETAYTDPAQSRTDEWIQQAIVSPDPARFALDLAASGDWATYERMMNTWEGVVGESITMGVHTQILAALEQAQQAQAEPVVETNGGDPRVQQRIKDGFAAVGIFDVPNDPLNPTINQVLRDLGSDSALVQGAAAGDAAAIQGVVEIARSRTLTTRTLRVTDDTPRPDIQGEGQSPVRTPPKEDPFAEMDVEWRRMGVLPNG